MDVCDPGSKNTRALWERWGQVALDMATSDAAGASVRLCVRVRVRACVNIAGLLRAILPTQRNASKAFD